MKHRLIFLGLSGVAVVGSFGWVLALRGSSPNSRPSAISKPDASASELRARVATLSHQVAALNASHRLLAARADQEPAERAGSTPEPVAPVRAEDRLSVEEEEATAAAYMASQRQALDAAFEQEKTDSEWSATAHKALAVAYAVDSFPGMRADAECRTTFCRIHLSFDDPARAETSAWWLSFKQPWAAPSLLQLDTATGRGVYYVARPDRELPLSPQPEAPTHEPG